jgi:hypothetical protein
MKWMQLLFSRTLSSSHTTNFVDAWTSYLRDSHANPFPPLANDNQPTTQDTCTRGSQMELPLADQESCCLRMSKESSQPRQETENPYLNMSSETWKKEVTERRGAWLVRTKSALHTNAKESLSWGTPQASDYVEGARTKADSNQKCLGRDLNRMKNWPTPRAQESTESYETLSKRKAGAMNMTAMVRLAEEAKQQNSPPVPTNDNTSGKNRELLSPNFVEQLMGVPVGLTQLPTGLID